MQQDLFPMFRKSSKYSQLDLLSTPTSFLTGTSLKEYEDTTGWHHQFCTQVTQSQAIEFQVHGKKVRMDSKLLGSNIAWYSRYELVHETLRKAYPDLQSALCHLSLNEAELALLDRTLPI